MKTLLPHHVLIALVVMGVSGCGAETGSAQKEGVQMTSNETSRGIAGLPHSQGRVFEKLDDYLAHLKKMGAQDRPFYEKVGANRYKLNVGRSGQNQPAKYFSHEDLMRKYGFSK